MSPGRNQAMVARALSISGVLTIVIAVVLAMVVEPYLIAIALVGIVDLVLARMFASGRLGSGAAGAGAAAEPAGAAAEPEPADPTQDPSYNPYARED